MKKRVLTTLSVLVLFILGACNPQNSKINEVENSSQVTKTSSKETKKEVSKAFQEVVEQTKPTMEKMAEIYADIYSSVETTAAYPETIVFTYTYKDTVVITQEQKEQTFQQLALAVKSDLDKYKKEFPNFQEQFIYLNPDKSEVANLLVTQKDVEAAIAQVEKSDHSTEATQNQ